MAATDALEMLKEPCNVDLYSDSKYLTDAINKDWLNSWVNNGWKKADKKKVMNIDLWQRILIQTEKHCVNFIWVKGHAGNEYNEVCDTLAVEAYTNAADFIDENYENDSVNG